jgi:hypothetical protein
MMPNFSASFRKLRTVFPMLAQPANSLDARSLQKDIRPSERACTTVANEETNAAPASSPVL